MMDGTAIRPVDRIVMQSESHRIASRHSDREPTTVDMTKRVAPHDTGILAQMPALISTLSRSNGNGRFGASLLPESKLTTARPFDRNQLNLDLSAQRGMTGLRPDPSR
ncbi:MAG: hypothetical protein M2R45_05339 [Verrucomicrobia subdivision 3 bacterium]|nr:hypothetical protein [Limisphaerales bacterium]MCS1417834.1 hypothetical protein [Limisphaerales bacterium]